MSRFLFYYVFYRDVHEAVFCRSIFLSDEESVDDIAFQFDEIRQLNGCTYALWMQ